MSNMGTSMRAGHPPTPDQALSGTWRKKSGSGIFHFKGQTFYEPQKKLSFMRNRLEEKLRVLTVEQETKRVGAITEPVRFRKATSASCLRNCFPDKKPVTPLPGGGYVTVLAG